MSRWRDPLGVEAGPELGRQQPDHGRLPGQALGRLAPGVEQQLVAAPPTSMLTPRMRCATSASP